MIKNVEIATKQVLASMIQDKEKLIVCCDQLTTEFFPPKYRKFFLILKSHFKSYKAVVTEDICQAYIDKHISKEEGQIFAEALFEELSIIELEKEQFDFYLDQLKEYYTNEELFCLIGQPKSGRAAPERDLIQLLADKDSISALDLIRKIVKKIDKNVKPSRARGGPLSESSGSRMDRYVEIRENPELAKGFLTGFDVFDELTNGVQNGEFCIFYGPSGSGKSITLLNMAYYGWSMTGKNVLMVSIEMSKERYEARLSSRMSGLEYNKIKNGLLTAEQQKIYFEVLDKQKEMPNYWYTDDVPRGCTIDYIYGVVEKLEGLYGSLPDAIFIDYLELMNLSDPQGSDVNILGKISEELHEMARYLHVPVFSVSQVTSKRHKQTRDEVGQHRIARAERIIHNADIAIQMKPTDIDVFNDPKAADELSDEITFYITKCRDNPMEMFMMKKDFSRMLIQNISRTKKRKFPGSVDREDAFMSEDEIDEKLKEKEKKNA